MGEGLSDFWADQTYLRETQYATDRNLEARRSIYVFQEPPIDLPAEVIGLLPLTGAEVIADVGCGNGVYLAELARQGHTGPRIGCDLSPGMLRAAASRARSAQFVAADAAALPLRRAACDLALAMHMLYHVPSPAEAIAELRRVTRPGGRVVVGLNGADHLAELRALVSQARETIAGGPTPPLRERLSLDDGAGLLTAVFESVERHDFAGYLVLRDPQPIAAYVASMSPVLGLGPDSPLPAAVASMAPFGADGSFRVRAHCGVLICS